MMTKKIGYNGNILLKNNTYTSDGDLTYETIHKFNKLYKELYKIKFNWGFCIDTANLWSNGINITNNHIFEQWYKTCIFKNKIKLIYLNGSGSSIGSFKRNIIIPKMKLDQIWSKKNTSFDKFVKYLKRTKIPIIITGTNSKLKNQIRIINELLNI